MKKLVYILALPLILLACAKPADHAEALTPGNEAGWGITYWEPSEEDIEEAGFGTWATEVHPNLELHATSQEGNVQAVFSFSDVADNLSVELFDADSVAILGNYMPYTAEITDSEGVLHSFADQQTDNWGRLYFSAEEVEPILRKEGICVFVCKTEDSTDYTFVLNFDGTNDALAEFAAAKEEAAALNGWN